MADADVKIGGDTKEFDSALDRLNKRMKRWARNTTTLIGAALSFKAIEEIGRAGHALLKLSEEQADAERKLAAVLRATGNETGFTAEQLKAMASQLQAVTTYGDEATIEAQALLATFKQVRGDVFADAIKSAQDMATVLGSDLQQATLQLGKALNDPVRGMGALARSGVSFTEQQREMIKSMVESGDVMGAQKMIIDELKGEFGGAAEALAQGPNAKFRQFINTLGDVGEDLGDLIAAGLQPMLPILEQLGNLLSATANFWRANVEAVSEYASWLGEKLVDSFKFVLDIGIQVATGLQTAWEMTPEFFEKAWLSMRVNASIAFGEVSHFFTVNIPELMEWFQENWFSVFLTVGSATETVVKNLYSNFKEFFGAIASWLAGDGFDFEWKGLTEGFKSSIKELPKLTDRELTESEKVMLDKIDSIQDSISTRFETNLANNRSFVGAIGDFFSDAMQTAVDDTDLTPEFDVPGTGTDTKTAKDKAGGKSPAFEALEALNQRIAGSAAQSPEERAAKASEDMLKEMKGMRSDISNLKNQVEYA